MNERQPYERHLADKLNNLPPPAGDHSSWEEMRSLLDKEMPRGGSGGGGGSGSIRGGGQWWIFGTMTALVFLGTWLTGKQFVPSRQATAARSASAIDSGVKTTASPPVVGFPANSPESTIVHPVLPGNPQQAIPLNPTNQNNTNKPIADEAILHNNSSSNGSVTTTLPETETHTADAGKLPPAKDNRTATTSPGNNTTANSIAAASTEKRDLPSASNNTAEKLTPGTNTLPSHKTPPSHDKPATTSRSRYRNRGAVPPAGNVAKNNKAAGTKPGSTRNGSSATSRNSVAVNNKRPRTTTRKDQPAKNVVVKKNSDTKDNDITHNQPAPVNEQPVPEKKEPTGSLVANAPGLTEGFNSPAATLEDSVTTMYPDYVDAMFPPAPAAPEKNNNKKRSNNDGPGTFVVGLTLPLNLPINDQQALSINRNAKPSTISDYIPSVHLQYHINPRTYVQTELQFSAPQFISPQLLYQQKQSRPFTNSSVYTSIYARKLYYFNLPVTIHFSPLPGMFMGAGVQYSSLLSGIALTEERQFWNSNPPREMEKFKYSKFKNDSLSDKLRNNEWRLVVDFNYYFNRFTIGMRYNQALSNYADFRMPNSPAYIRDKNKSLQFYVRYNVWENRRQNKLSKTNSKSLLTFK
ncbi:MAG: hypothetical protein QM731_21505 [Chitinophagaceae bacterium]